MIIEHCDNEYYITMRDDTDLESLAPGMDKLVKDEDDPNGIISDWDDEDLENKEIHIYLQADLDNEESWRRIGNTIGMSLQDLSHAKKLMTSVYRARFKDIPENSLWDEPWPNAKPVEDYDGDMITLSRLDQLKENTPTFLECDWLEEVLLFYLDADEDNDVLLQEIERLLLMTEEQP